MQKVDREKRAAERWENEIARLQKRCTRLPVNTIQFNDTP